MAFHYVFNDYSGVEFNLLNYQKYTIKVLGAILLLVKLSSLIKIYLRGARPFSWGGGERIAPLAPP
jgi:hypothetical protein